ncbi:MAG: hypothetical protein V1903_07915 [Bacteroidota bacterium]
MNIELYNIKNAFNEIINEIRLLSHIKKSTFNLIKLITFLLSVMLLLGIIVIMIRNIGKVFYESDAVFSYNRWATDFYNNKMPWSTYHYPQLIPANWSIAYVLCEYPLQFIPRIIMHFFMILPIYVLIIIGLKNRSASLYFSAFFVFLGLEGQGLYWTDGFVDVPVAFFSFMVFISLILIRKKGSETDNHNLILLSILFACGSAVTKQAGLFVLAVYPLLLTILSRNNFTWSSQKILKFGLLFLTTTILIVVPYYFWAELQIKSGNAASEIKYITHDIYRGASYLQRFADACRLYSEIFSSKLLFTVSIVFFLISFADKTFRFLIISFIIPYFVIWALLFSEGLRNVAIIIPYFAIGIGIGLDIFFNSLTNGMKKIVPSIRSILSRLFLKPDKPDKIIQVIRKNKKVILIAWKIFVIIFILAGILLFNKKIDLERLIASQNFRVKSLGDESVNQLLYEYNEENHINKLILTNYVYLKLLPELNQYYQHQEIQSLEPSSKILTNESIGYLLWVPWYVDSSKFPSFIEERIRSGIYEEIFIEEGFRFIKIR